MEWSTLFKIVLIETIIRISGLVFVLSIQSGGGGAEAAGMFALIVLILFFVSTITELIVFILCFVATQKIKLSYKILGVNSTILLVMFFYTFYYTQGNIFKMSNSDISKMFLLLFVFNVGAILSLLFTKKI